MSLRLGCRSFPFLLALGACSAGPSGPDSDDGGLGHDVAAQPAPDAASDALAADVIASDDVTPPPSPCSAAGLLLCDDFESDAIDASRWTSSTNHGGLLEISQTHARSGTRALHAHVPPTGGADAHVTETQTFPAAATNLFGRAWFFLEPSAPVAHVAYFAANGPKATYTFASQDGTFMALAYFASSETADHSATGVPIGKWSCLEWNFDGGAGTADYWIDGALLTDMHEGSWAKDAFQSHDFGISLFETDTGPAAYDVWFDDIAIGTARIGCP